MSKIVPINKDEKISKIKAMDFGAVTSDSGLGLWESETSAEIDLQTLKGLFFNEDWVFIILDLVASEVSNAPMVVVKSTQIEGRTQKIPVENHKLMPMIQQPNAWQDYSTWMYVHTIEYNLMGNAIQWFAGQTMQMAVIPAESVQMVFDDDNVLTGYMVSSEGGEGQLLDVDDILHQRRPNPSNMMWGLSPFIPNKKSILFNRYSQDYLNAFYLKGATPQMILQMEKNASEDSALRMLRSFETSYTGRRNQRRTLVLPKGVTAETVSHSIGDQRLVDIINSNMEKILNILRVPKHALSLAKSGSLGSEEHKMALKYMHTSVINPTKIKIAGNFTKFFRAKGLLAENEEFMFDNSNVEVLKEDEIKRADLAKKQSAIKTLNEVRADLYDLPPLEGGDVVVLAPGLFASSGSPPQTITPSDSNETEDSDDKKFEAMKIEILEQFEETIKEFGGSDEE